MMSFSVDIDFERLIPAKITSYSVSLLYMVKPNCMDYSILSLVKGLSCKPIPVPVWQEASSTLRIHQPALPWSTSGWGSFAKKSTNIYLFNAKRGLYWIPNSLSSITPRAILQVKLVYSASQS